MLPFTKSDTIYLASALVADNDVSKVLEPATGAVSLESNAYEDFVVEVSFDNKVATAGSVSVQFYEKATADGDVSATWAPVEDPIVVPIAAAIGGSVSVAKLHSRLFALQYATAIATVTFADQNAATYVSASLRGELARRDI